MADESDDLNREREDREREARERGQRAEQLRAEERAERERFRERERQRDDERERDRARIGRVERERQRYEPSPYQQPVQIKEELGRLVYASARASTDVLVGIAQVFGNLVGSMKDSFLPGASGYQRGGYRDDEVRYGGRRQSTYSRGWDAIDDVRSAVRETADVVARSGENFSRYYDRGISGGPDEGTERRPRAEQEQQQRPVGSERPDR
jgi:hypothetical protein